jgi:hypothetical protein
MLACNSFQWSVVGRSGNSEMKLSKISGEKEDEEHNEDYP